MSTQSTEAATTGHTADQEHIPQSLPRNQTVGASLTASATADEGEDESTSASSQLAAVVRLFPIAFVLACPSAVMHGGQSWQLNKTDGKRWTTQAHADLIFDTFTGDSPAQQGHCAVRCRECAEGGQTSTHLLRGGRSSNAWRHFDSVAMSGAVGETQRGHHADVAIFRAKRGGGTTADRNAATGPLDGYLRASNTKAMTPAPARPHHLRFVLIHVMTLSPHALAGSDYLA